MEDLEGLVERIRAVLAGHPVAFAYVFGSVARGEGRSDSDVDVAVHFEPALSAEERFDRLLRVGVELEIAAGREVDVVDLDQLPVRLVGRILTERVVVVGLGRAERVRFESEMFRRAVDLEFHARALDAALLEATAAGER
jgi:uncharacterized protein